MAPDAEDCEEVERLNGDYEEEPVHQGRRILPEDSPPAVAWTENEELGQGSDSRTNSPGENRRLLGNKPIHKSNSRLQAGLTLGVWGIPKWTSKTEKLSDKTKAKTKFQKRKEKIFEALKPPYFIISMLFIIVMFYLLGNWVPESWRLKLEWSPGPWWNQPWRMFTYGLIHAGPAHIALNALVALAVGWRLEREQSWSRVAFIWMGGVAAGALGAGAFQPRVRVVGASAAVYALLTAHVPNVCFRYGHIPLWWFRPLSVVVLGASEGCWSLLRESDPQDSNNVAWAAHVLGAAVGIPLGFVAFTGENSSKRCIKVLRVSSFLLLTAGIVAATIHYMFYYEPDDYT